MIVKMSGLKLHKVRESGEWTNVMVLNEDDALELSVKGGDSRSDDLRNRLKEYKGKVIDLKLDAIQKKDNSVFLNLVDVAVNGSKK